MGNSTSQPSSPSAVKQTTSQGTSKMPRNRKVADSRGDDNEYEVEDVLGREVRKGVYYYQLKWKGYAEPTWQSEADTECCKELIAAFEKTHPTPSKARRTSPASRGSADTPNTRTLSISKGIQSKKSRRDSSSESRSPVPSSSRSRPSKTATSNGKTRNQRPSSSPLKSRAVIDSSSISSSDSQTPPKKTTQKRPATSRKTPSSSSESDNEEERPTSSRMSGKSPKRMSPKKTSPSKRKRDSSSSSESDSDDESQTSGHRGPVKRTKRLSTNMDEDISDRDTPRSSRRPLNKKTGIRSSGRKAVPMRSYVSSDEEEEVEKKEKAVSRSVTKSPRREPIKLVAVSISSSDEEEVNERKKTAVKSATKSARKEPIRPAAVASSDSEEEEDEEEEAPTSSTRARIAQNGNKSKESKLVAALAGALVVEPFVVPLKYSPGKVPRPKGPPEKFETILPIKIFKPEDLPGIEMWTVESYADDGFSLDVDFKQSIEKFAGRDVEKVVGYCLHPTYPSVLVHLAKKKNEKDYSMKEAVQAVHVPLAARLFPKAFADYTNRMARISQFPTADNETGPSRSTPVSNGRGKKGKGG